MGSTNLCQSFEEGGFVVNLINPVDCWLDIGKGDQHPEVKVKLHVVKPALLTQLNNSVRLVLLNRCALIGPLMNNGKVHGDRESILVIHFLIVATEV